MEPVNSAALEHFFEILGKQLPEPTAFYLLGGSALLLLGNIRTTLDIDYTTDLPASQQTFLENTIHAIASPLKLDVEFVPIKEFIPLPRNFEKRHRLIGKFSNLEVFVYDVYSIAISKIARGFDSDLEDVIFLLEKNFLQISELEKAFQDALPGARAMDIDPREFKQYFAEIQRRWQER